MLIHVIAIASLIGESLQDWSVLVQVPAYCSPWGNNYQEKEMFSELS